ncbi:MAG: hypothetical protein K0S55_936, partial [Clostridia bacterium]|nr:hypothetical protein [Clostridia bacterium]
KIVLDMVVMSYDGSLKDDVKAQALRTDFGKGYGLTVNAGTEVVSTLIPTVKIADNKADFSVSGGSGNCVVKVEGFMDYTYPAIKANGAEIAKDGYQVYVDSEGYYGFAFVVPANSSITIG